MPLSIPFALAERAVWALGAATIVGAIGPVSGAAKAAVGLDSFQRLLDRGGALDTPERASWLRGVARSTPPDATASIEPRGSLRQRDWVDEIESFFARCPPERGGRSVSPSISDRREIYAGWADGRTTVVLTLPA
jgi:hypothetical protein